MCALCFLCVTSPKCHGIGELIRHVNAFQIATPSEPMMFDGDIDFFTRDPYGILDQLDFPLGPSSTFPDIPDIPLFDLATPPQSYLPSPELPEPSPLISVSTTFFKDAPIDICPSDVILITSDCVSFYVHCTVLCNASSNNFDNLLSPPIQATPDIPVVPVSDTAAVLTVILHAIYEMPYARYSSIDVIEMAVGRLGLYGVDVKKCVSPAKPLYTLLLSHAPLWPLEVYTLAAAHSLEALAVAASSHLLGFDLSLISDQVAIRMGSSYLKRLLLLHHKRAESLKLILLPAPHPHPPSARCSFIDQSKVTRAWALATASFAWDARPGAYLAPCKTSSHTLWVAYSSITYILDVTTSTMESALKPLLSSLTCEQCQTVIKEKLRSVVVQWNNVEVYILVR